MVKVYERKNDMDYPEWLINIVRNNDESVVEKEIYKL